MYTQRTMNKAKKFLMTTSTSVFIPAGSFSMLATWRIEWLKTNRGYSKPPHKKLFFYFLRKEVKFLPFSYHFDQYSNLILIKITFLHGKKFMCASPIKTNDIRTRQKWWRFFPCPFSQVELLSCFCRNEKNSHQTRT